MRRIRLALAVAAAAALIAAAAPVGAISPQRISAQSDAPSAGATVDTAYALVQLRGAPLSTDVKTKPAPGKKIDFNNGATKALRAQLSALRNDFKQWLRTNAPKAQVTGSWDISLNAVSVKLNGTSLATLRAAPQAIRAEYEGLYYPTTEEDPDLALISATQAWAANGGSSASAGAGIKVAIVDTGIDQTHPCFNDAGYLAQPQLGNQNYTNNKVIVAKVFNNKLNQNGFGAAPVQEHGTHVAGTVACNFQTPATVNGVSIPYGISGVAPHALLGSYNIFPGKVTNARSEDIFNALDAAYADDMDVANMSLGGGSHGFQDLLTVAVDNLDRANMVVAVAAGNSGPGHFTVESPGSAARALTAGASSVPHFVGAPIIVGGTTYGAAAGDFPVASSDIAAPLGVVLGAVNGLSEACSALTANSLSGKIALISRGTCTFSTKIRNAATAGALAVLVANNVAGDPVAMASDGTADQPTVPAYMVALSTGLALNGSDGAWAKIGATLAYISTPNKDIMAGFSSQGPTDVDFRVKPDVVAPGVNVLSSIPKSFCDGAPCFAFFQGTSMATPHLAGAAAIVIQQHPTWPAWAVRSAIVNRADVNVLTRYTNGTTKETDVNVTGSGRLNLLNAVTAPVVLDPVSVSFGAVASGSGVTKTFAVRVMNAGKAPKTLAFAIAAYGSASGVTFSVAPASATVAAGASTTVTVTGAFGKATAAGGKQAWLTVSDGASQLAHAAVYAFVK